MSLAKTVLLLLALPALVPAADTYTNPVGDRPIVIGDPFVLRHGGRYYLFGTNAPDGLRYLVSNDLVHWTEGGYAWRGDANSWSDPPYWAPEVKFYQGKFFMTYSGKVRGSKPARLLTALAVSDRPEGPYRDLYAPWFDPGYSVIDADIFVDSGGTPYLYFSRNGMPGATYSYGAIYGVQLTRDLSKPVGELVKLLEADQPWERINWDRNRCNEGPAEMFIVYHSHADPAKPSSMRMMNIDRMVFEGGGLRVLGPTRTPQPMPSAAR